MTFTFLLLIFANVLDLQVSSNYLYLTVVAKKITGHADRANDLVSETYLNLHTKGTKVPDVNDEFIKFFVRCMKNRFLDEQRTKKEVCDLSINLTESEDVPKWVFLKEIEDFKATLTDLEQIFFELCYEKGLSKREISALLNQKLKYSIHANTLSVNYIKPLNDKIKKHKWIGLTTWDY